MESSGGDEVSIPGAYEECGETNPGGRKAAAEGEVIVDAVVYHVARSPRLGERPKLCDRQCRGAVRRLERRDPLDAVLQVAHRRE